MKRIAAVVLAFVSLPCLAMTGTAYSARGPVANAKIALFVPDANGAIGESPLASAKTDASGSFSLDVKTDSVVFVRVEAAGYVPVLRMLAANEGDAVFAMTAVAEKSGSVRATSGPVAGAKVVVTDELDDVRATYDTDEHGRFSMPDPRTWATTVCVQHPAYAAECHSASATHTAVTSLSLDFNLVQGTVVTGRVVKAAGAPVPNARVSAGHARTTSSADGTFKIRVGSADKEVRAIAGDMAGRAKVDAAPVTITVQEGRTIVGSVRDEKGRAIAGVRVVAQSGEDNDWTAATANAKGEYTLQPLDAAQYGLFVQAPDEFEFEPKEADVRKKTSARVDLTAKTAQMIRGTVRDENRQPVAGAVVMQLPPQSPLVYAGISNGYSTTVTGADGKFRISAAEAAQIAAIKPGYAAGLEKTDRQSSAKPVVITLPKGLTVNGTVVDGEGKPLRDAGVVILAGSSTLGALPIAATLGSGYIEPWVRTDERGAFTVQLNRGIHDFGVWKKGYAGSDVGNVEVTDKLEPLRVVLGSAVEIRGRVTFKGNKPATELSVFAIQPGQRSYGIAPVAADGTFVIESLQPGAYMLRLSTAHGGGMKSVTAPATDVVLEAGGSVELHGRVTDKSTGAPITKFEVSVQTDGEYVDSSETENANGEFVQFVPEGPVQLSISAPGYVRGTLNVTAATTSQPLALALTRGRKITGRITSAEGHPLAEATVSVSTNDSYGSGAMADEDGEYVLEGAPAEEMALSFSKEGFLSAQKSVAAGAGDQHVDVVLKSGLKITGRVVDKSGTPVEGATISASSDAEDAGFQHATSYASGAFTVAGLAPAAYTFRAAKAGVGQATQKDVDVRKGQPLVFTLGADPTGTIHGTIAGVANGGWMIAMVIASTEHDSASGQVGRDGKFVIENAPAGEVTVRGMLMTGEKQSSTKSVKTVVPVGGDVEVQLTTGGGVAVRGIVRSAGQPVPGATVSFYSTGGEGNWQTQTGIDGSYEVSGLDPGHFAVTASRMEGGRYSSELDVTTSATFDINMEFAQIAGHVVDDRGAAIEGAKVTATSAGAHGRDTEATTDASGSFSFTVQGGSDHRVSGIKSGYVVAYVDVPNGSTTPVTLRLRRGTGARVRLIDVRDGSTLSGFVVVRDESGKVQIPISGDRQPDGSLFLPLPDGTYRVSASANEFASNTITLSVPSADATIPLTRGGTLVVRSDEKAMELIRLVMPNGDEYVRCYCNGIAEIRLTGAVTKVDHVAPGSYRMDVVDGHGATRHSYAITINEAQQTTVDATK